MNLYQCYFDASLYGIPYKDDKEALEDVRAFADCCVRAAFWGKESTESRLDMRGVVITPAEVEEALSECSFEYRNTEKAEYLEQTSIALSMALEHVLQRNKLSTGVRFSKLLEVFQLDKKEIFFFCLVISGELDRKYERLFGYLQDNVAVRLPTRGLLESLWKLLSGQAESPGDDSIIWQHLIQIQESAVRPGSGLSVELCIFPGIFGYLKNGVFSGYPWNRVIKEEKHELRYKLTISLKYIGMLFKEETKTIRTLASFLAFSFMIEQTEIYLSYSHEEEAKSAGVLLEEFLNEFDCRYGMDERFEFVQLKPGAVPVPVVYEWNDLILEDEPKRLLKQLCGQIHYQDIVREKWGFGKKSPYGNGVSALFYGPPGTGKTMAAQVIAKELDMKLFKVDISQMISKYIGETEKNLSRLFDKASKMKAVLFFDEADGLFSSRTEVKSSNDKYANMETGYLLQKFEEYSGVSILATNFVSHVDDAFKRRIKFLIKFTLPGANTRLLLWKSMIPDSAEVEEPLFLQDYARYFEIPGSAIREIITNAAYLAAEEGRGICNCHVKHALKVYYMKYGRTLTEMELERCGNYFYNYN